MISCRTLHCEAEAVFRARTREIWAPARGHHGKRAHEEWTGYFCHKHLVSCLEVKLYEVSPDAPLTIERIAW